MCLQLEQAATSAALRLVLEEPHPNDVDIILIEDADHYSIDVT